jgi:hypothetical protein
MIERSSNAYYVPPPHLSDEFFADLLEKRYPSEAAQQDAAEKRRACRYWVRGPLSQQQLAEVIELPVVQPTESSEVTELIAEAS